MDAGVTSTILWVLLVSVVFLTFRQDLRRILQSLDYRLRSGAPIKLAALELEAVEARPRQITAKVEKERGIREDDGNRRKEREAYYERTRRVMLVHRVYRSNEPGQLYDLLIYLIPAYRGTLAGVQRVEYYFGGYGWKNRIFPSTDRSRGFPVLTASYGAFLCTAEVFFTDGTSTMLHRYVDFEMGESAPTGVVQEADPTRPPNIVEPSAHADAEAPRLSADR